MSIKFDTFYYSEDNSSEHSVSEVQNLSRESFDQLYKGKAFCPLCKKVEVTLVRGKTPHLRGLPKQQHGIVDGKLCIYMHDSATSKMTEEYISKLNDEGKIKRKLESVMYYLFSRTMPKDKNTVITKLRDGEDAEPLIIQKEKIGTKYVIPHYTFNSWGEAIPQDQLLIVYGKASVQIKNAVCKKPDGTEREFQTLQFRNIKTKRFITSCAMPVGLSISEGDYYVVALGMCKVNTTADRSFYNLKLNSLYQDSIIFKPYSS